MTTSGTAEAAHTHDAFISYSRKDGAFARRLELTLESYKPPKDLPVPQRPLDVFRDEDDFTGTEYSRAVDLHLSRSKKLLLLCSPHSCRSLYVDDEIRRFLRTHPAEDVIPLLLSGIPNNEARSTDDPNCAFPPALTEALEIPLAADFRGVDATRTRLDRGANAGAWYSVLANMYGQSRAVIEQREARRQSRRRRVTAGIVGGIIAALSVALAMTIVSRNEAEVQRDKARQAAEAERNARLSETVALRQAEASRDEALRQRAVAEREAIAARRETAERLSVQAVENVVRAPERALRLGIDAIESFHRKGDPLVPAAIGALQKATLSFGLGMPVLPQSDPESPLTLSDDLRWAALSDARGNVRFGRAGSTTPVPLRAPTLPRGAKWQRRETGLVFGDDRLFAMRAFERSRADEGVMVWYWQLDARGAVKETVVLETYTDALTRLEPRLSADGRWLAWSDGWDSLRLRGVTPGAKTIKQQCSSPCRFTISGDSKQLLGLLGTEVARLDLSGDAAAEPLPLPSLEWDSHDGGAAAIAVYAGQGALALDVEEEDAKFGEVSRFAVLTAQGKVNWWNLHEPEPVLHSTGSMLQPYQEKLKLPHLLQDHLEVGLEWNQGATGVIATVKRDDQTFGIAAVSMLYGEPKWWPLWHRYDGKATETSSRSSNASNDNYRVFDSADLGVEQAIWYGPDAFVTLGFDGSVWWRAFDRLEKNQFQLVAREASSISTLGDMVVVGGRDGAVRFSEEEIVAQLRGHDAPVTSIRMNVSSMRMVSFDTRGVARGWSLQHPAVAEWLEISEHTSATMSHDARTLITMGPGGRVELRDANSTDSLAPPRIIAGLDTRKAAVTVDRAGRWIGALDLETDKRLRLRLWKVDGLAFADRAPLVRRYPLPRTMKETRPALGLYSSDSRLVVQLGSLDPGWVVDSRDEFAKPYRLGSGGKPLTIIRADEGLRWLVVASGGYDDPPKKYFLVDLASAHGFGRTIPLPANMNGDHIQFDAAGRWLGVGVQEYSRCLLDLAAPRQRCIPFPKDTSELLFGPQRAPLAYGYGTDVFVLDPSSNRFRKLSRLKGSRLAWDAGGDWLVASSAADGIRLYPVTGALLADDAVPVRLPDAAEPPGDVYVLAPYVDQRWIFASTSEDHLLSWRRDDAGQWSTPVMLEHLELRTESSAISLRDDGRTLVVGLQAISLDPDRLVEQARKLMSGRRQAGAAELRDRH